MRPAKSTARLVACIAAAGLVGSALAACGGGGEPGGPSGPASGGTAGTGEVTDIQWWAYGPVQAVADQYIAAFQAANPDVKVTYKLIDMDTYNEALRPALMSNAGPDVFTISPGQRFDLFSDFATDLTDDFVAALGADWKDEISAIGYTGLSDAEGHLLAAPVGSDSAGNLWYNKGLFDEYGLTPPATFDEWKSVCDAFRADGVGCFVQGAQSGAFNEDTFQSIANSVEPGLYYKAVMGQARWDAPQLVTAFERWKYLFDSGIMQDGALGMAQYPEANNAFLSGKYAMVMMGSWYMQNTRVDVMTDGAKAAGKADGPATILPLDFPIAVDGGRHPYLYGDTGGGLAVNSKSAHMDAAKRFATFMGTSGAGQGIVASMMTNIPSLRSVVPDYSGVQLVDATAQVPALKDMLAKCTAVSEARHITNADLEQAIWSALSLVADGSSSPSDAASQLQGESESLGIYQG